MPGTSWSVSADWIVPVAGPPVRDAVLRMRKGRIEAVGPSAEVLPAKHHESLGAAVVLPGLVNAHTHLELTDLRGRLPRGRPFTEWLLALLTERRRGIDFAGGTRRGARELLAGGCTTLGDISHDNGAWPVLKRSPQRKLCFAEVIGIGPLAVGAVPRLLKCLAHIEPDERLDFGVSPHAPYSTAERVYRLVVALARRRSMPITTHLAETPEENVFLRTGKGRFSHFLAQMGLIDRSAPVHNTTAIGLAERVGLLDLPAVLAHVHYVNDADLDLLAAGRASVVYCPRSSAFFGRSGHRYPEMLARGINVSVGTDSLASNDSLDMLAELRVVRAEDKLPGQAIIRMGTAAGARALGLAERIGTLAPTMSADWIAVPLSAETADPVEAVLTGTQQVSRVVIAGQDVTPKLGPHTSAAGR